MRIRAADVEPMAVEVHGLDDAYVIAAFHLLDVCPKCGFCFFIHNRNNCLSNKIIVFVCACVMDTIMGQTEM